MKRTRKKAQADKMKRAKTVKGPVMKRTMKRKVVYVRIKVGNTFAFTISMIKATAYRIIYSTHCQKCLRRGFPNF